MVIFIYILADVYSKFLQRLPDVLQRRLAVLNYIPGSFNAIEAKEILGNLSFIKQTQYIVLVTGKQKM